ncbi:MAG: cell wall hydrolase [Beijerinckiaceae bacterium]|nr:cell wall hydrolase [Beijerinckiaceae bacterium]
MGHSRVGWMFGAVAPWCLGVGLAVSVPADAGVDSVIGASFSPDILTPRLDAPDDLVPPASGRIHLAYAGGQMPFREARLSIGETQDFAERPPAEHEPRRDLKPKASSFPEANIQAKGDPFVGLRPTFDARLRANGVDGFRQAALTSSGRYLAFEGLQERGDPFQQMDAAQKLTPTALPEGDTGRSARPGRTGQSPRVQIAGLRAGGTRRSADGSTPQIGRAIAMSSTTPAPFDERLQVVYAPAILEAIEKGKHGDTIARQGAQDRPDYASLVNPSNGEREERCLAEAIYFEARSEPAAGQAAVAQVVLNRVRSGLYPASICGVVYQNRHRYMGCQFSFACEGKSLRITEPEPWKVAARIAKEVLDGKTFLADIGGSTHYHANYVRPRWAKRLKKMDTIGSHIFYKLKPGQT